jgi:copper transport protein
VRFDENVSTPFGAVRVLDENARRIDDGKESRPSDDSVAVGLPRGLPRGTYTVVWRVISADTHPVHGAFTFSVGAGSADAGAIASRVLAGEATPRSVSIGFGFVRFLRFAVVLLAGGGALLAAVAPLGRRTERTLAVLATALVPVAAAGIVCQGAVAGGFGLADAARWSVVDAVLGTRFGVVWTLQAGLAALLALGLFARLRVEAAVLGVTLAAATTAASHASTDGALAIAADGAHVVAAAAWIGGLAAAGLALVTARGRRWATAARVVPRFSLLATAAVGMLIAGGTLSAYLEVRSWHALWTTAYGRLVLVKIGLLLPLVALGAFNNRVSVAGLRIELEAVRRRFVQAAAAELALAAAIVAVTAALVEQPPAKAQAARGGIYSTETRLGPYELDLTVDPARLGPNDVHLYLLTKAGQPADAAEAHVYASLSAAGLGPLRFQGSPAGPGHFAISRARLAVAGDWRLRVEVRFGSFDQYDTTLDVPIRKD